MSFQLLHVNPWCQGRFLLPIGGFLFRKPSFQVSLLETSWTRPRCSFILISLVRASFSLSPSFKSSLLSLKALWALPRRSHCRSWHCLTVSLERAHINGVSQPKNFSYGFSRHFWANLSSSYCHCLYFWAYPMLSRWWSSSFYDRSHYM
jgi:hypothetical protein